MSRIISIRQPWAWMILHAGKDIENRTWPTKYRGKILIHASKGMTLREWQEAWWLAMGLGLNLEQVEAQGLTMRSVPRGGIVGEMEIVDCVTRSESPWFQGPYGFVLANPRPLPFEPCQGKLGIFRK